MKRQRVASWEMHALGWLARLLYKPRFATEAAGRAMLARPKRSPLPPRSVTRRCSVTSERVTSERVTSERVTSHQVDGFVVHTVRANGSRRQPGTGPVAVYLHGGAYCNEIVKQHWSLIADLAEQTGCEVHVPIYGLAPQHNGLEARDFVLAVLEGLAAQHRPVHLIGDSSGAGLALIAAQAAVGDPAIRLTGATLIAPWLDLTLSNPGVDAIEPVDPWLTRAGLRPIAAAWADGTPLDDPRLSPIRGDLSGLPPIDIWVGTRDITLPDCRLLRDRLPAASVAAYREIPGAIHVVPLLPVPEGRASRRQISEHVARQLTDAGSPSMDAA